MFEKFRYRLQPDEQEQAFLARRFEVDKQKMRRVYRLALCIISTFLLIGIVIRPPSLELTLISLSRALGIGVTLAGLMTVRKAGTRRGFEWAAFGCLSWLTVQLGIVQFLTLAHSETLLAWNVFVIFLLYLTVPIPMRFRLACAIFLSVASIAIWFHKREGGFELINGIGLVSVYLASNVFGVICASNTARTEREEFLHLESEKQLKASLETTLTRLEESVESRNKIYRILAHDLRGGIGALGSIGGLLADDKVRNDNERQELIELICESSKSSYELLDNLLQWAISESESVDPNPEAISLNHSVSNCVGFLEVLAHGKKIDLSVDVDVPITVWADSKMLDTVIRNLTSNAIKFTQPGGRVQISAKPGEQGVAVISVTDSGVGIEPERLSRIFNLKHDESSSGTKGETGTNLGLRICMEFVRKNGGEIWATSDVANGTQFSFTVPMHFKTV